MPNISPEVYVAIKVARRIANRYEAEEFDEAKGLFESETGPRVALSRFIAESSKNGQVQVRETARRLLTNLLPTSPSREHGQLIRTCCDELLEVLRVEQGDESADNARAGGRCSPGQAGEWILDYLCAHHGYDGEGIDNWSPLGVSAITKGLDDRVSKGAVSEWFKKHFDNHAEYVGACGRQENGPLLITLRKLREETTTAFVDPSPWLEDAADRPDD